MVSHIFLDIGNTNTKWKFNGDYSLVSSKDFELSELPDTSKIWASNVSQKRFEVVGDHVTFLESQKQYKSLINAYDDYKSLGSDRWFAMIASYEISYGKGYLLIDLGTAITIDAVSKSGTHLGGFIFPGLKKVRETFNNFPISSNINVGEIGQSTEKAWTIGTLSLIVNTINKKIKELKINLPEAPIFLTGGGYQELQGFFDFEHDYHQNLVLDGLEFFVDSMR